MHPLSILLGPASVAIVVVAAAPARPAAAYPPYLDSFKLAYPASTLPGRMKRTLGQECFVCHQPPNYSAAGNCYREALLVRLASGVSVEQAFVDLEPLDSDGDGISNLDEILRPRTDISGEIGYNPGLIGPSGTDPCSGHPNNSVTGVSETPPPPPPVCPADVNHSGAISVQDIFDFLATYFAGGPAADFNHSGAISVQDIFDFFAAYFAGCP